MITRITRIERIDNGKKGFQYRITVTCNYQGDTWDVVGIIGAGDLLTYQRCQRALAHRVGVMYVESSYRARGGAEQWCEDVQELLAQSAEEGAGK